MSEGIVYQQMLWKKEKVPATVLSMTFCFSSEVGLCFAMLCQLTPQQALFCTDR